MCRFFLFISHNNVIGKLFYHTSPYIESEKRRGAGYDFISPASLFWKGRGGGGEEWGMLNARPKNEWESLDTKDLTI